MVGFTKGPYSSPVFIESWALGFCAQGASPKHIMRAATKAARRICQEVPCWEKSLAEKIRNGARMLSLPKNRSLSLLRAPRIGSFIVFTLKVSHWSLICYFPGSPRFNFQHRMGGLVPHIEGGFLRKKMRLGPAFCGNGLGIAFHEISVFGAAETPLKPDLIL